MEAVESSLQTKQPEPVIKIRDLVKVYGQGDAATNALRGISLDILPGEFIAVMGPSGSGKSTLMNILGCLDRPTSGTYILDGEDVSDLDRIDLAEIRNEKIGFIFQSFNLLPRLTAVQNVILPMLYDGRNRWTREEMEDRAIKLLASLGLGDRLHHRPSELSGGQQQRVAIARALVNEPAILFADEPTGNLDTESSREVIDILKSIQEQGATIVMVTHEPDVAAHAQKTIHVLDGEILEADGNSSL
ncbi:MAG: ABC transporter ATP-binding protein [Anaerolineaceae bacterium]|nr:ABC transporter ATP-binding protein [Anaerolineaceae bacterium]